MAAKALDPIHTYVRLMEDIKVRVAAINTIAEGRRSVGSPGLDSECIAVQLRKIIEQIAFASLCANRQKYAAAHNEFEKEWNAKRLLKNLAQINHDFYPFPVRFGVSKEPGVAYHLETIRSGFLTLDDFVELYGETSEAIHAPNPFAKHTPVSRFRSRVPHWVNRIQALLKLHVIRLVDSDERWVIQMERPGDHQVHFAVAQPIGKTGGA